MVQVRHDRSLEAGQNAVDYSLPGAATGALNFVKTTGGAFGAALFGAMAAALVLALVMREEPLSEQMLDVVAGKPEAPEY